MSSMHFAPEFGFTSANFSSVFSWKAGFITDLPLNKHIFLQSGVTVSQKGQDREFSFYTNDTLNAAVKQSLTIYYIDLPVTVVYKTGMQGKGRFFAGLGATPSYILGGRNKLSKKVLYNGTPIINNYDLQIVAGSPLAMFDIGLNLSAGYELPTGWLFRLYYTAGMRDIGLDGEIDKNRNWGISAGYFFGKGRNINKESDDLIDHTGS